MNKKAIALCGLIFGVFCAGYIIYRSSEIKSIAQLDSSNLVNMYPMGRTFACKLGLVEISKRVISLLHWI